MDYLERARKIGLPRLNFQLVADTWREHTAKLEECLAKAGEGAKVCYDWGINPDGPDGEPAVTLCTWVEDKDGNRVGSLLDSIFPCPPWCG